LELRTNAALAINYLTYSEKWQISAEFLSLGILDVMAEAFAKYEHSNPDALKRTMLIIMSNITANSEAMAELVFNHRIFGVVI
jgi:phosphoglycerate dehydrogenase-like enzyme